MSSAEPEKPQGGPLILRDRFARNRTSLANERTFLAYIRTALTLFVAGVTFIRFFGSSFIEAIGWALVPLGVMTLIIGIVSFRNMRRDMRREEAGPTDSPVSRIPGSGRP